MFLTAAIWYSLAAWHWTRPSTPENHLVLRLGAKWGGFTGMAWTLEVLGGNVIMPHEMGAPIGVCAALTAAILPFAAGAEAAAQTGQIQSGARAGFWTGVVSGLIAFLILAAAGYAIVFFPGMPHVQETPPPGADLDAFNIGDFLAGGISHLFLIGAVWCGAAGTAGSWIGRSIYQTRLLK